jgi:AcrR family transcriptional regulator
MGRPRNADPALTRQRILDAAIHRFGEQGLKATSLRTIAADAGVTFATVHHHFGTKDELHARCVEECFTNLEGLEGDLMEVVAEHAGNVEAVIRRTAMCAFGYALERNRYSRFLLRTTLFEGEGPHRERLGRAQRDYLDTASRMLAPVLGRSERSLRVPLQGLMFLLTRVALTTDAELETIGGDSAVVREELRAYVGEVAVATLVEDET